MRIEFGGLRALVTGSTRGIGKAIASSLAASGASVVVHGRKREDALRAAQELHGCYPDAKVGSAFGDLATPEGCASVLTACPKVDIVVHNAGMYEWLPFFETTEGQWLQMLQTNLL